MNGPSPEEVLKTQLEFEQKKRLSLDAQKDELLEKERLEKEKNDKKDTKSAKEFPMTFNLFNFRKVFGLPPPKYKEFVFTSRLGKKIRIRGKTQKSFFQIRQCLALSLWLCLYTAIRGVARWLFRIILKFSNPAMFGFELLALSLHSIAK